jgi:hypothetical protein
MQHVHFWFLVCSHVCSNKALAGCHGSIVGDHIRTRTSILPAVQDTAKNQLHAMMPHKNILTFLGFMAYGSDTPIKLRILARDTT